MKIKGEITAFLSFVLLIILAMIGTILEGSRLTVYHNYADRALITSMDSVLAEYNRPLYDGYHLFLLDTTYGGEQSDESVILEKMSDFMNSSFHTEKEYGEGKSIRPHRNFNLFDINIDSLNIIDKVKVMDYNFQPFLQEVLAYMKYQLSKDTVKNENETQNKIEEASITAQMTAEKLKMEEKASLVCIDLLDFIEKVEGLKTSKTGLIRTKIGLLDTESVFAKQICNNIVSKETVGIKNNIVFQSLHKRYFNLYGSLDNLLGKIDNLQNIKRQQENISEEISELNIRCQEALSKISETENFESENIDETEESEYSKISAYYEEKIKSLENQMKNLNHKQEKIQKAFNINSHKIEIKIQQVLNKIQEALNIIPKMKAEREDIIKIQHDYNDLLESNKNNINADVYNSLKSDSESLNQFSANQNKDEKNNLTMNQIHIWEQTLLNNKNTLEKILTLTIPKKIEDFQDLNKLLLVIKQKQTLLQQYEISRLEFDYTTLTSSTDKNNPMKNFHLLISDGILGLVVDDLNKISNQVIHNNEMVENQNKNLGSILDKCEENGYQSDLTDEIENFKSEEVDSSLIDSVGNMMKQLMLTNYIITHFDYFLSEKSEKKVLKYEQEFLIFNKEKDRENFEAMVLSLVSIRTIMNYLYLLTDKMKLEQAYAVAAGLVGFTGLTPLISLTKTILLLICAYEESLIDVRGLLDGKYVPFWKSKNTYLLNFNELLLVDKDKIKEKAERLSREKGSLNNWNYEEYLKILLYFKSQDKKCTRILHLIEENMKLVQKTFSFHNCIYGFEAELDCSTGARFLELPFMNGLNFKSPYNYFYSIKKQNSY